MTWTCTIIVSVILADIVSRYPWEKLGVKAPIKKPWGKRWTILKFPEYSSNTPSNLVGVSETLDIPLKSLQDINGGFCCLLRCRVCGCCYCVVYLWWLYCCRHLVSGCHLVRGKRVGLNVEIMIVAIFDQSYERRARFHSGKGFKILPLSPQWLVTKISNKVRNFVQPIRVHENERNK